MRLPLLLISLSVCGAMASTTNIVCSIAVNPASAPVISNVSSNTPGSNSVSVTWTTSKLTTDNVLRVGTVNGTWTFNATNNASGTSQSNYVSGLTFGTYYYGQVECTSPYGLSATNGGWQFTTAGGVIPAWHDILAPEATDTPSTSDPTTPLFARITLTSSGNATKLRVWSDQDHSGNVKVALYNSSKALLAYGTIASQVDNAARWLVVDITPQAVAAGDYYIGFLDDTSTGQTWRYLSTGGFRYYKFGQTYSGFPENPIGEDGSQSLGMAAGVYIQ